MQSTIHFYGGAGSVTGSNFLLDTGGNPSTTLGTRKILVDCGLEQGGREAEATNWEPFAYDPASVDTLVVTHAHIDHIGRIPLLVRRGFKGQIISTAATLGLARPMLEDAMGLMNHKAERRGVEELYSEHDIEAALKLWRGVSYHEPQEMGGGVSMEFFDSGHILGSAMARFTRDGKSILFTGDLGGGNSPLLPLCESPVGIDYLVMESVYGDRMRSDDGDRLAQLEQIIEETYKRGGVLLIPAFSTERTQDIIFDIRGLMLANRIPSMPVFLDSPLAEKITAAYLRYPSYFAPAVAEQLAQGEKIFEFPELRFVKDAHESAAINKTAGPKILIAGSGMSNGGRVLSHEAEVLPDVNSTLLIVGYQAAGSLGRRLVEGAKVVEIQHQKISVRCRVEHLYGYSAHMQGEQLVEFVNKIHSAPDAKLTEVFVVMGEPAAASFLAQRLRDYLGVRAVTPEAEATAEIDF